MASSKRTDKVDTASEQRFRDNLVQLMRRHLFVDGDPENECLESMQWLCASHIANRDGVEWSDIHALTEQLAVQAKPLACEIIERAKRQGRPE